MSTLITLELAQTRSAELARELDRAAEIRRAIADRQVGTGTESRGRLPRLSLRLRGSHHLLHV